MYGVGVCVRVVFPVLCNGWTQHDPQILYVSCLAYKNLQNATLHQCCRNMNTLCHIDSHIVMLQLYNIFLCRPNKYLPCDRNRDTQHYVWRQKDTYLSNMETQSMQSRLFIKLISLLLPCISRPEMLMD